MRESEISPSTFQRNSEIWSFIWKTLFTPPSFSQFNLIAGPNQSISNSWINGKRTFSKTYTYFLSPKKKGTYKIGSAKITFKDKIYKTLPVKKLTKRLINNLKLNTVLGITFYSMLAVDTFISLSSKYKILSEIKKIHMYCISKRVAKPFQQNKFKYIHIAQQPNQLTLVASINKNHFK